MPYHVQLPCLLRLLVAGTASQTSLGLDGVDSFEQYWSGVLYYVHQLGFGCFSFLFLSFSSHAVQYWFQVYNTVVHHLQHPVLITSTLLSTHLAHLPPTFFHQPIVCSLQLRVSCGLFQQIVFKREFPDNIFLAEWDLLNFTAIRRQVYATDMFQMLT